MSRKIGLATAVYNAEKWIYPFLRLTEGLDKRVLVLGKEPFPWVAKEHGVAKEPDRTEALVKKCFPDVEIIYQQPREDFGANFWNQGHEYLADKCDFIFRFDADEMMMPLFWYLLVKHVKENLEPAIAINFGKDSIMFYYDLDHGMRNPNQMWIETRGLDSKFRYQAMGAYQGEQFIFSPPGFVIYHYTGLKRGEKDKDFIKEDREWLKTPDWLKELFKEGWDELDKIPK